MNVNRLTQATNGIVFPSIVSVLEGVNFGYKPLEVMGLGWRVGRRKEFYKANVVA
jgi:hypothetical protein